MIAVIFEVEPAEGRAADYLETAARLRPLLDGVEGFISVERFESLATPGRYLSLSFWEDEDAVGQWRNTAEHRAAQSSGRAGLLRSYRLRIASVVRDYGLDDREEAPADSQRTHQPPSSKS
jgi:heme-degrading monooxygenase HmoA